MFYQSLSLGFADRTVINTCEFGPGCISSSFRNKLSGLEVFYYNIFGQYLLATFKAYFNSLDAENKALMPTPFLRNPSVA